MHRWSERKAMKKIRENGLVVTIPLVLFGISAITFKLKMVYLTAQLGMLAFYLVGKASIGKLSKELLELCYPDKLCVPISKYEALLCCVNPRYKKIPREMFWTIKFYNYECVIASFGTLCARLIEPIWIGDIVGVYIIAFAIVPLGLMHAGYMVAFKAKYKRITFRNCKYFFWNPPGRHIPNKEKVGKCMILEKQYRIWRTYYVVQTEGGDIYKKVYCEKKNISKGEKYMLYEVYGVKFII